MPPSFCQFSGPARYGRVPKALALTGRLLLGLVVLLGLRAPAATAQTFYNSAITLVQQPSGSGSATVNYAGKRNDAPYNTYTRLGNRNASPVVPTPNVGTYDLNGNSQLKLDAASIVVSPASRGLTYLGGWVQYRVYLTSATTLPAYTRQPLAPAGTNAFGEPIYSSNGTNIDLLNGLNSGSNYTLEVQFGVDIDDGTSTTAVIDPAGSYGYSVAFYVTPPATTPPGGNTTWQSTTGTGGSTDWTLAANWTNGVPTRFSNAIIPPRANSTVVYPILTNPTTLYEVNDLTLQGNQSSSAGQLTINAATLRVYGDISQVGGGLTGPITNNPGVADPVNNSTLLLAGADQLITGNLAVSDVVVAGSGVKSVLNQVAPGNILTFQPSNASNGVLLQSTILDGGGAKVPTFDPAGNTYVQLSPGAQISIQNGQSETNSSYVRGVVRADRLLTANAANGFGNIGLTLTPNHTPGNLVVYRVVGAALPGPTASAAVPIKRYYRVVGDDNSNNPTFAGSTLNVAFRYLNSNDELNGDPENRLQLFRTLSTSAPYRYQPLASTRNLANRTVSLAGLSSQPDLFLTLGDQANPLPVELTSFTATRQGPVTELRWSTAQESNNARFEVEASGDGAHFARIGTVAGRGTTTSRSEYQFTDAQLRQRGAPTVYYRLRQVDYDGTATLSPVRAVPLGADEAAATLHLVPNPAREQVRVLGTAGPVEVLSLTGRLLRRQASPGLVNLAGLPAGVYLVRAATRTARLVIE